MNKHNRFQISAVSAAVVLTLAAGVAHAQTASTVRGVVAGTFFTPPSGPAASTTVPSTYQGATVCFDANDNGVCDAGEPSALTAADGSFTLSTRSLAPLIAQISTTASNAGHAVTQRNVLRLAAEQISASTINPALPASVAVTPLSTEIARTMDADGLLVDISALDERARGRDVLQMPVLESLGLVRSSAATALRVEGPGLDDDSPPVPVAVKRYELTPLGEQSMRERVVTVTRADGDFSLRRRDLCAARLALAEVVAVAPGGAPRSFVATYTYDAEPASWATSADFQRVFPLAARVIGGSRQMRLKQAFAWKDGAWTPDGLAN